MTLLAMANLVAAAGSIGFGLVGLLAPRVLHRGARPGYFPAMYAARAIPLGLGLSYALVWGPGDALLPWLVAAAAAQLGDVLIGAHYRTWGMCFGAGLACLIHCWGIAAVL